MASSPGSTVGRSVTPRPVFLLLLAGLACAPFLGLAALAAPRGAAAMTITQVEAPMLVQTADPHQGAGDGVADADTAGKPADSSGPSPVLLLIAALGLLIGVLVVTRPRRRGPD